MKNQNAPKGATHMLNEETFMKWVRGKEYAFINKGWVRASDGWTLDYWLTYHPDQLKELSK